MKRTIKVLVTLAMCFLATVAYAGFSVSSGKLLDGNGKPFVMRGVNFPHSWYTSKTHEVMPEIANTKANTVRVVLSNGYRWTYNSAQEVADIISLAKQNKLITVLEVHDTTGYGQVIEAAPISSAVDYWLEIKDVLVGQEDYVIINIGNEPFGNNVTSEQWTNEHAKAISRLRAAGLTHTLMVDAPHWGTDYQNIMRDNAHLVLSADPLENTIFSVHMYQQYNTYDIVNNYLSDYLNKGIVIVVGEFGDTHMGEDVDEVSIMERSEALQVGYLGWSWSGNSSSNANLDVVVDWDSTKLSGWGSTLLAGSNGINQTSMLASVFSEEKVRTAPSGHPYCTPTAIIDPEFDGWGWENNQSCVVEKAPSGHSYCTQAAIIDAEFDDWGWENNQSCVVRKAPSGHPYCTSEGTDTDGWGWENDQTCVVMGSSADRAFNF